MSWTLEQVDEILNATEGETVEFKKARNNFHFDELAKYAAAISNEGGGLIVMGVTDQRPRRVVGTRAFEQPERTRSGLISRLHLNITFSIVQHPDGRVLVFHVPPHPTGMPVKSDGIYWQRQADSLVPMSEDRLRGIFAESGHDFSSDICTDAVMTDLKSSSIEDFRQRWIAKSDLQNLSTLSHEQLLSDAEAMIDGHLTYAALILFGTHQALGRHLAQAEVIFEYRSTDASGPAQQREEFRLGFFGFYDRIWDLINLRNDVQHFQSDLFILDVPTFSERAVREAVLNTISHRDYQLAGSVFVRQYPRRLRIESPGGFPVGIDENNILDCQSPRNRRIADIFAKFGKGRRAKYVLSPRYYRMSGDTGAYTRKKRIDRETNKTLLEKYISDHQHEGSPIRDLLRVLPALTRDQVKWLLQELRNDGRICLIGEKRGARWYLPSDRDEKGGTKLI